MFGLNSISISCEDEVKLLGLTFFPNCSWCQILTMHFCVEQNTRTGIDENTRTSSSLYLSRPRELVRNTLTCRFQTSVTSLKARSLNALIWIRDNFDITIKNCSLSIQELVVIKHNIYNIKYGNTAGVPRPRTSSYGIRSFSFLATQVKKFPSKWG